MQALIGSFSLLTTKSESTKAKNVYHSTEADVRLLLGCCYNTKYSPSNNILLAIRDKYFPTEAITLRDFSFDVCEEMSSNHCSESGCYSSPPILNIPKNFTLEACEITSGAIEFKKGKLTALLRVHKQELMVQKRRQMQRQLVQ